MLPCSGQVNLRAQEYRLLAADDLSLIAVALKYHNMSCKSVWPVNLHDYSSIAYAGSRKAWIVKRSQNSCNVLAAGFHS